MSQFILSAFADEIAPELEIQLEVLAQHGIDYIEMRGVNGRNITQHSLAEVKEVKKRLEAGGFKISAIGSPLGKQQITDDFQPHLELFRHTLAIAQILETSYIRMFSFFIPKGEEPARYRSEVLRRWEQFLNVAAGTGITLLHENEKDIYGDTPERCLDLLKTLSSSNFRAIFDPANFVQCDISTYPDAFQLLQDYLEYMHIKDALARDHSVVPAGFGDGKIPEILAALRRKGFNGFLSLEPHLGSFVGFAELELDSAAKDLPEGGPQQFGVATAALRQILKQLSN